MELSKNIKKTIEYNVKNKTFSGCSVGLVHLYNNSLQVNEIYGGEQGCTKDAVKVDKYTYFDLASLTKPLVTVLSLLALLKENKLDLNECLADILPVTVPRDKHKITIKQLINHSSGFPAHRKYFNVLRITEEKYKKDKLIELLLSEDLEGKPGEKYIYSDLDYMLLGVLIEIRSNQKIGDYWLKKITDPLHISDKFKLFGNKDVSKSNTFAATGSCPWSGRPLQGIVHDDNCRGFGRIMGHAGLFSTLKGLISLSKHILLNYLEVEKHPFIESHHLSYLLKPRDKKRWAYGFDIPTGIKSSSGRFFSKKTIGHLGYTGTSLWIDLTQKVIVIVLSNRVIYGDDPTKMKIFRPLLHDEIMKELL